jgi:hypothetical protein
MWSALAPGGLLIVEDVDFRGHFSDPECAALQRYVDLYVQAAQRRGGDPMIGPRLPRLLQQVGCQSVRMHVVHPAALQGDVKLLNAVSMECISDTLVADGLASCDEAATLVAELHAFARDSGTVMSVPRVVQAWGKRGA